MARRKLKEHHIQAGWCKGCGICVAFCPKTALELNALDKAEMMRPEDCVGCGICALRCPDLAIQVDTEDS